MGWPVAELAITLGEPAAITLGGPAWGEDAPMAQYLASCRALPKYAQGRWLVLQEGGSLRSALIVYRLGPGCARQRSNATPSHRQHRP